VVSPNGSSVSEPGTANRVHAIIVTYHPDTDRLTALLDSIGSQVAGVVLVDNGSAEVRSLLADAARKRGFELLPLEHNVGVAAAHNLGIAKARTVGADSVLLLDQDSLPAANMVVMLAGALRALERSGEMVAAVGPCHVDQGSRTQAPFVRFGFLSNSHVYCGGQPDPAYIDCDHLITSGTLISLASLDRIGGLDEELFVDNVDTEWCFRAISNGFRLFGVCRAQMSHSVGEGRVKTWVPLSDDVVVHGPIRLYYIVRNHVLLYKRFYVPRRWILQDVPRLLFKVLVFGTAIHPRLGNLAMMIRGFWDGIRGRTGPYPNA
jgi:rhamnosyltransferase